MSRLLGDGIKNILRIKDRVSGDEIVLYYRLPTTEERVSYFTSIWNREKGQIKENIGAARIEGGKKILEGIGENSFSQRIDGEIKAISCDPESSNYQTEWKEWVLKFAPDIIETLAREIFETGVETESGQEESPIKK